MRDLNKNEWEMKHKEKTRDIIIRMSEGGEGGEQWGLRYHCSFNQILFFCHIVSCFKSNNWCVSSVISYLITFVNKFN